MDRGLASQYLPPRARHPPRPAASGRVSCARLAGTRAAAGERLARADSRTCLDHRAWVPPDTSGARLDRLTVGAMAIPSPLGSNPDATSVRRDHMCYQVLRLVTCDDLSTLQQRDIIAMGATAQGCRAAPLCFRDVSDSDRTCNGDHKTGQKPSSGIVELKIWPPGMDPAPSVIDAPGSVHENICWYGYLRPWQAS